MLFISKPFYKSGNHFYLQGEFFEGGIDLSRFPDFAGTCFARASRAIAPEGGGLAVEAGGVFVGPLAGAGIVTLEQIYPVALGANIGTTVTCSADISARSKMGR